MNATFNDMYEVIGTESHDVARGLSLYKAIGDLDAYGPGYAGQIASHYGIDCDELTAAYDAIVRN